MRSDAMHTSHGVEHIVVAAPGTDADLCDQHVTGLEAELTTDSAPIDVGMKATEVGARVDDLDLLLGDAGCDEPPLDRLAHGDDGRHARRRIAKPVPAIEREADAPVEHEHGDPCQE